MNSAVDLINQASFYDYDVHGNVKQLLQDYGISDNGATVNMMNSSGNRFKSSYYKYDLISGKVNGVYYQPDFKDTWQHEYDMIASRQSKLLPMGIIGKRKPGIIITNMVRLRVPLFAVSW